METEPTIGVTEKELAYRSKNYHELRAAKQRQSYCASCGNIVSLQPEQIFSHPAFGVSQCGKCYIKSTRTSDRTAKTCGICECKDKHLYRCGEKNCRYTFCEACIKRNASPSLVDAKSKNWKCFACDSRPLWKLRAVCNAVMSSISKRTKRKKVSRNKSSSDTEDRKTDLRKISYVRRRREIDAKKLRNTLSNLCDAETPSPSSLHRQALFEDSSADVTDAESPKKDEEDSKSPEENRRGAKNHEINNATSGDSILISSSDDSDVQEVRNSTRKEKIMPKKSSKAPLSRNAVVTRGQKNSKKIDLTSSRRDTSNEESDGDDVGAKAKSSNKRKPAKAKKQANKISQNSSGSESDDEARPPSRETREKKKPQRNHESTTEHNPKNSKRQKDDQTAENRKNPIRKIRGKDEKVRENQEKGQKSVETNNSEEDFEDSRPKRGLRIEKLQLTLSDSSSSKEFEESTPNEKSSVNSKLSKTREQLMELLSVIDRTQADYTAKNTLRSMDVDRMIFKANKIHSKLTDLGQGIKKKRNEKIKSPRKNTEGKKSSPSVKNSKKSSPSFKSGGSETILDEEKSDPIVSECNSEEIFSAEETRPHRKTSRNARGNSEKASDDERSTDVVPMEMTDSTSMDFDDEKVTAILNNNRQSSNYSPDGASTVRADSSPQRSGSPDEGLAKNHHSEIRSKSGKSNDLGGRISPVPSPKSTENSQDDETVVGDKSDIFNSSTVSDEAVEEASKEKSVEESAKKKSSAKTSRSMSSDSDWISDSPVAKKLASKPQTKTANSENCDSSGPNRLPSDEETDINDSPIKPAASKIIRESISSLDIPESFDASKNISSKSPLRRIYSSSDDPESLKTNKSGSRRDPEPTEPDAEMDDKSDSRSKEKLAKKNLECETSRSLISDSGSDSPGAEKLRSKHVDLSSNRKNGNFSGPDTPPNEEETEGSHIETPVTPATHGSIVSSPLNTDEILNKSSSHLKSLPGSHSSSSNCTEIENLKARERLGMSSSSDDSSPANSTRSQRNNSMMENADSTPTPPESDSKSGKSTAHTPVDRGPKLREKRSKFRLQKNRYYLADEKLRQKCQIRVERLPKRILRRHKKALKKSHELVELRKLKRLVSLGDLEKKKKICEETSSDDDDTSTKLRTNRKKLLPKADTLIDHLKKVGNGEDSESGEKSEESGEAGTTVAHDAGNNLMEKANEMAKKGLLESSGSSAASDGEDSKAVPEGEDKKKSSREKSAKPKKSAEKGKTSDDDKKEQEKSSKSRWRQNKILTLKLSDSDSDEEKSKFERSQESSANKSKTQGSDSDSERERAPKKKRVRRRVLNSDSDIQISALSDSSESSDDSIKKKKKKKNADSGDEEKAKKSIRKRVRRKNASSDSSSSLEAARPKNRRKRIKKAASDSDSDNLDNSQGTPGKSGRKNIRKVIRDKQVADDTKQAAKDEEERLQRIAERQKLYNEMYENRLRGEEKVEKLVLDFDEETKEPLISVDEALVKRLKPHQAQGIKFMWDACFESLERAKTTKGSGCILAHCMGLGKSFQIVSLAHTLLQHETGVKTIMVVCPLSTVLNWVNEFKIWLADLKDGDDIEVYELTKTKKHFERKYGLAHWQETGGVMIIGYEMFRNLSNPSKKLRKNIQETFFKCLIEPGPDLIICDEGHLLKNEDTALSKAMRRVRTLRRIVLTGTPLQNNLIEYHCMVQFVKPNLLGTKKEFINRFESPITNGQFDDSTEYDVKLMKKRAHVLHKMLEGSVQRMDYSVLTPFLPYKQEYVIFVKLTDVQIKMYQHYLDNYARRHRGVGGSLFADFQALQRIWTHPMVIRMNAEKVFLANEKKRLDATDSEGSLKDFIDDGSDDDDSDSSDVKSVNGSEEDTRKQSRRGTRLNPVVEEPLPQAPEKPEENNDDFEWWSQFVKDEDYEDMRISSKLLLLFQILKDSEQIGDKLLVFSQSLYSLTLIEKFLGMIDDATQKKGEPPESLDKNTGSWSLGLDYFRLDGQTSPDNRRRWCEIFNRPSNTRARLFLISTRAGGLGINLTAANRVIIFDASWNPSHDVQSIFRIYRFGQKKPCYVYRLLAAGTMEQKIYNRQVTKLSLSCRVVDEQQIERHYTNDALTELYKLEINESETTLNLPKDRLIAEIFLKYKHCVENYHEHDSLLENQAGEELDEEERKQAWIEYEEEKKGKKLMPPIFMNYANGMNMMPQNLPIGNPAMMMDYENLQQMMMKDYPGLPEPQQKLLASQAVYQMYNYVERQALQASHMPSIIPGMPMNQGLFNNRMAPLPASSHPTTEMMRVYQQSLAQPHHNGPKNYATNSADSINNMRNNPVAHTSHAPVQPVRGDDDIVEIGLSPERPALASTVAPSGSRKSQEE